MGVIEQKVTVLPDWFPKAFSVNMIMLAVAAIARGAIQWFKVYAHSLTFDTFSYHLRSRIARWALLSVDSNSGQVITLLQDRIQNASALITAFQNLCIQVFSLSLLVVYLMKSSFSLALAGLGVLVLSGLSLKWLDRYIRQASEVLLVSSSEINERLLDALRNLHFLKICRSEVRELGLIQKNLDKVFRNTKIFTMIKSCKFAAPQFVGVAVIIFISYFNRKTQALAGGAFVSFIYIFMRTAQTSSDLSTTFASFRLYGPQFFELFNWWNSKGQFTKPQYVAVRADSNQSLPPTQWKLDHVGFSYEKKEVLKDVELNIPAGKITVVTGPSGRGKSTLLHLLSGIVDPDHGKILVESKNKNTTLPDAIKNQQIRFGYVGPDPHVIHGTVKQNLLYGFDSESIEKISDADIYEVLKKAHCDEFLNLPNDLSKTLSDRGEGLSTGQKQRLALARALLRKPSALLLDEPTANLDELSESKVVDTLRKLKGETTMVIVTHRKFLLDVADNTVEL